METTKLATSTRVAMVWPPAAEISIGVADLRAEPDAAAELVDQAHLGERMRVLGARDGWRYVQGEDHYFGWIRQEALLAKEPPSGARVVVSLLAPVRAAADARAKVIGHVPAGTVLFGRERGQVAVDDTVPISELPQRPPTAGDLLATARSYLGVPYLWGGTTAHGLDCSGLVQQVYRLNGVGLPRDADQQAVFGRPVERASAGDLLFFGEDGVTHVALALGETEFLHAPQSGAFVEKSQLGPERRLRAIRRYLPDVTR